MVTRTSKVCTPEDVTTTMCVVLGWLPTSETTPFSAVASAKNASRL